MNQLTFITSVLTTGVVSQGVGYGATKLTQHSFEEGLNFNNTLASWNMLGSAIPTRGPFSLLPPVVDRASLFFHKQPILTEDWEASFTFNAEGGSYSDHKVGFGFWASERDVSRDDSSKRYQVEPAMSVGRQLQDQKWDLWGFPRQFNGFGVLFTNFVGSHELTSRYQPSVDVVIGNGQEQQPWRDIPSQKATSYDFRNSDVLVNVRYQRGQLTVDCTNRGSKTNVFTGSVNMRSPTYIGFTGYTGETYGQRKETKVDHVKISNLVMNNYDSGSKGEDAADYNYQQQQQKKFQGEHDDFIRKYSSHEQERAESKTIVELTHVVNKLVSETEPLRHQMQHAIVTLTTKVQTLEESLKKLKDTIQTTSGHTNLDAEFEQMKKELFTLSNYASNQHDQQQQKLKAVHEDLAKGSSGSNQQQQEQMRSLVMQNEELRKAIESGSSKTFWLSLGVVCLIAGAGFALYTKFKNWEKKHIL